MTAIQAVFIRGYEERTEPKPHTVYRIEIQASVRSWQMWRRYSEFVDLNLELAKSTGSPPPAQLPPKHAARSLFKGKSDPAILDERRHGLELYLRAILSAKEDKWRESFAFRDFLGVPVGKQPIGPSASSSSSSATTTGGIQAMSGLSQFTSSSWLDEQHDLQSLVRDVRADINRRDALGDRNDIAGSQQANVQAKKKLAGLLARVGALEGGLRELGMAGMSEGEMQRRADMVLRLRDECERLGRMVTVARLTSRGIGSAAERNPASSSDRAALLGDSSPSPTSASSGFTRPITRRFGVQAAEETEETRPLDDRGVFQMQEAKMEQQDVQLAQLTTILQRQKHLGLAINNELVEQTEMLDDLNSDVGRVGNKLTAAKKQLNRLG